MAGQNIVTFEGSLLSGPPRAACATFPAGVTNIPFSLRPPNKSAPCSAKGVRNLDSANAFSTMHGVGANEDVTQATFLFVQTQGKMTLRLTTQTDSGDRTATVDVDGILAIEFPAANYLKMLEAQGVGVVEYFASGNQ
jgi:hypothetical protein